MLKLKNIILFVLALSSIFYGKQQKRIRWEKILTDKNNLLLFVSGSSDNYWVQDSKGTLFNIAAEKVYKYKLPVGLPIRKAQYLPIGDNDFFYIGTNSEWKGEIFRVRNNIWFKYKNKLQVPVNRILKVKNKYYIIGDSGLFLTFQNNRWVTIRTPFESHCITAVTNNKNLIISTKGDGVYVYYGNKFIGLKAPKNFKFIKNLKTIGKKTYGLSVNNKLFVIKNDSLIQVEDSKLKKYFFYNPLEKFGFKSRWIFHKGERLKVTYPMDFNIREVHVFNDTSIILLSKDGNLFKSQIIAGPYFTNLAAVYQVEDLPNSENISAGFFDADNDGCDDLLIINKNFGNYLTFYQGVKNSYFANITSITNLPFNKFPIEFFSIADFNKDGLSDIVLLVLKNDVREFLMYKNLGNFKFRLSNEFKLIPELQTLGIRNLLPFDYDSDGDADLIATSYYGNNNMHGFVVAYQNNYWGDFSTIDTTLKSLTRHWNNKIVFADLNNDNLDDIYNATFWTQDHILINKGNKFVDETSLRLLKQKKTETYNVSFSDYDNDADLDIFTSGSDDFLRVYQNNGNGFFKEVTYKLFDKKLFKNKIYRNTSNLNFGDFNNDGFVDIITSIAFADTAYTALFINKHGKKFEEEKSIFEKPNKLLLRSTIADVDNDGDLDIYGTTRNHNVLWINLLDKNNSIKVRLHGIVSATDALGSKIWIYKHGEINNKQFLLGFKQFGTELLGKSSINSYTIHFGLDTVNVCDVKVLFPSGRTVVKKNIKAGSSIVINEYSAGAAFLYEIPGDVFRFFDNTENQIYTLLIIFSHLFILFGLWYGFNNLRWTVKLTAIFGILNISFFWISLYFSTFLSVPSARYLVPLGLTVIITIIPLILFYWLNKTDKKDITGYNERLLKLMMSFSHGEIALRNLNSIILFCENLPSNWKENIEFQNKLNIRFKTFLEMTSVSINEIIELEKLTGNQSEELASLEKSLNEVKSFIIEFKSNKSIIFEINQNFVNIRKLIKKFRDNIYARFSSCPTEIINNVIANYESALNENNIVVEKTKKYPNDIPVLIKGYELGDILDNLFQNAIKFMNKTVSKKIIIELYKDSPKIIIKFTNTGTEIPVSRHELIFEQGYSESGSTGQGLYNSREVLKKYGGRIFVESSVAEKTTFKIELNEGVKK